MHITRIWMTKKEIQHTSPFHPWVEGWSFSPCWRWMSLMPLSATLVRASALTWCGGNLSLKLRLWVPKFGWTSSPEKLAPMSISRSSAHITLPEAPLPGAGLHHEEALLETIRDSEEMLVISIECHLLDRVSIGIPLVDLGLSPSQSKWLHRTQAACSPAEMVLLSEESSPLELVLRDMIYKTIRNPKHKW